MLRLGILASTKGTDMQAVIDAISSNSLNAVISVVVSNKKDAFALERARKHKIRAVFIEPDKKEREEYDKEVANELDKSRADLIILIGYMRILCPWFVKKYKNRIVNIHPSLLPKYAGGMNTDVHAEVLKNKEKMTGCTLHFVDESIDGGPIIMQKSVSIDENDTVGSLKEKVQKAEQEVIVEALGLFEKGKIKVEGKKVKIEAKQLKASKGIKMAQQSSAAQITQITATGIWWKDKKLLAGFILVLLSFILGFYGKVLFFAKIYEPVYLLTGLSVWAFSWILLFAGAFLLGWETVKVIQSRIHHHVKSSVKRTYHYSKELPRKGYEYTKQLPQKGIEYTKQLQRKGISRLSKISKKLQVK